MLLNMNMNEDGQAGRILYDATSTSMGSKEILPWLEEDV